jgi:hypothetical protein
LQKIIIAAEQLRTEGGIIMPVKMSKTVICKGTLFLLLFVSAIWVLHSTVRPSSAGPQNHNRQEEMRREMQGTPYESRREEMRREMQDRAGGLPPEILAQQSNEKVEMPTIDDAVKTALAAAEEAALPLIDTKFHNNGKTITVPDDL